MMLCCHSPYCPEPWRAEFQNSCDYWIGWQLSRFATAGSSAAAALSSYLGLLLSSQFRLFTIFRVPMSIKFCSALSAFTCWYNSCCGLSGCGQTGLLWTRNRRVRQYSVLYKLHVMDTFVCGSFFLSCFYVYDTFGHYEQLLLWHFSLLHLHTTMNALFTLQYEYEDFDINFIWHFSSKIKHGLLVPLAPSYDVHSPYFF